jgi:hypothetical protein
MGDNGAVTAAPTASNFTARKTTQSHPPHICAQQQAQIWATVEFAFKSGVPPLSVSHSPSLGHPLIWTLNDKRTLSLRANIDNARVDEEY